MLEITESAVMIDIETAIQRLHALRALGVSIAIDDFGTGHSSLALLRRLPVDTIKVDKMFVDTIVTDPTASAFLESIVRMAEILSLQVVVEGIETDDQAAIITMFGNVRGQGYLLGRPLGVEATDALLAEVVAGSQNERADSVRSRQRRPRLLPMPPAKQRDSSAPRAS